MRYLDPKNDLVFKKVFSRPRLLKSFLNALLPLKEPVEALEYLPVELVPDLAELKHSVVDVRCVDRSGRQFIVEMQMFWTTGFKSRVLFNAAKAYVRQADRAAGYAELQPVFSLNLVNQVFERDNPEYYHHYAIVEMEQTHRRIEGLEFVFVELPKFRPEAIASDRMRKLWLRFLTETGGDTPAAAPELLEDPATREALECVAESGFTRAELDAYDRYWDSIRCEVTLVEGSFHKGESKGRQEGELKGRQEGELKGRLAVAAALKQAGLLTAEQIAAVAGLSAEQVRGL
ncbi:MAG: Rpn family recombination-promoting nuclease/putative transposase [Verrucomicrobia bacterium]|nr:Rpn family recombination-promoting nuclease/putative transposase [Verrucomicrobiota bacterium]